MDEDTFTDDQFYGDREVVEEPVVEVTDADPAEGGQVEVTDTPAPTYFDPTPYADHVVPVKVAGEEVVVPVAELIQGYQRQADYTRKTQELAQEREKLTFWQQVDQAMQVNPALTMQYLQERFGLTPQQAAATAPQQDAYEEDDDWSLSPRERELMAEIRALKEAVTPAVELAQMRQAEQLLDQVVNGLTTKYGDAFNADEVIERAVSLGVYDPMQLEAVFHQVASEKYLAMTQAQQSVKAAQAAADAQRQAAAANAGRVIGNVPSASGAVAPPPAARPQKLSVREAFELAKAELGA